MLLNRVCTCADRPYGRDLHDPTLSKTKLQISTSRTMKKSLLTLAVAALFGLTSTFLAAAEAPADATIVKLTGSVKVQLAGATAAVTAKVGDKIPQGATITTGSGAEVVVRPFAGTAAVLRENSTVVLEKLLLSTQDGVVKKQSALLNLKTGTLVSIIDPSKRAINDYSIRTPQGVAAARGTIPSITVNGQTVTIEATADVVTFTTNDGTQYTISQGYVIVVPLPAGMTGPVSLASIAGSNPGIAALINASVSAFADALPTMGLDVASATVLAADIAQVAAVAPFFTGNFMPMEREP